MQANKGEWSELYVLLMIFANKSIAAADKELNPTEDKYSFLQVIREEEPHKKIIYDLEQPENVVICEELGQAIKIISIENLSEKAEKIFEKIKFNTSGSTFQIPEANELMNEYYIKKIKADSAHKSDIVAIVRDKIASRQELGFSIKSQLGSPSTLLNASSQTNFIFEITNFTGTPDDINSISGVMNRIKYLNELGAKITFVKVDSQIFNKNLRMIDTALPNILADILLTYYSNTANSVSRLCEIEGLNNNFELDCKGVSYKIKTFLRAIALGMVPSKEWDTYLSSYGGYIVVKDNGELVCYHLYNDDEFKDYLFNNTKLDTPSTSRHNFGSIYQEDGKLYIRLNIQIRFTK